MPCNCGNLGCTCQASCICHVSCRCMNCYMLRKELCPLCGLHPFPLGIKSHGAHMLNCCRCFLSKSDIMHPASDDDVPNSAAAVGHSSFLHSHALHRNNRLPTLSVDSSPSNNQLQESETVNPNVLNISDCQATESNHAEQSYMPVISMNGPGLVTEQIQSENENFQTVSAEYVDSEFESLQESYYPHSTESSFTLNQLSNEESTDSSSSSCCGPRTSSRISGRISKSPTSSDCGETTICPNDLTLTSETSDTLKNSPTQQLPKKHSSNRNYVSKTPKNVSFSSRMPLPVRPKIAKPPFNVPYHSTYYHPSASGPPVRNPQEYAPPPTLPSTVVPPFSSTGTSNARSRSRARTVSGGNSSKNRPFLETRVPTHLQSNRNLRVPRPKQPGEYSRIGVRSNNIYWFDTGGEDPASHSNQSAARRLSKNSFNCSKETNQDLGKDVGKQVTKTESADACFASNANLDGRNDNTVDGRNDNTVVGSTTSCSASITLESSAALISLNDQPMVLQMGLNENPDLEGTIENIGEFNSNASVRAISSDWMYFHLGNTSSVAEQSSFDEVDFLPEELDTDYSYSDE